MIDIIKEYKVITDNNLTDFQTKINEYIKNGWQPHGNMIVVEDKLFIPPPVNSYRNKLMYIQPIARSHKTKPGNFSKSDKTNKI